MFWCAAFKYAAILFSCFSLGLFICEKAFVIVTWYSLGSLSKIFLKAIKRFDIHVCSDNKMLDI
jgi:hypothetical protein